MILYKDSLALYEFLFFHIKNIYKKIYKKSFNTENQRNGPGRI
jgi:hypothetical protein